VTVSGCFGEAFEVTFSNGKVAQGFLSAVDHPGCEQRFDLLPGASTGRIYTARVPAISTGPFKLHGFVQVVSLLGCDRYGCDAVSIPVIEHPEVQVVGNVNRTPNFPPIWKLIFPPPSG